MINAVFWSFAFGLIMVSSFVLAMPDTTKAALQGANVFFNLFANLAVPTPLKDLLYIGIVLANYLCALAGVTSTSRMIFAFSRDGGLPGAIKFWRHVSPSIARRWRRSGWRRCWPSSPLCTLRPSAHWPPAAQCFCMSPTPCRSLPAFSRKAKPGPSSDLSNSAFSPSRLPYSSILGTLVVIFIGIQPPNNILINYGIGLIVLMLVLWFGVARRRFPGPPIGAAAVAARAAEIAAEEQAVGQG